MFKGRIDGENHAFVVGQNEGGVAGLKRGEGGGRHRARGPGTGLGGVEWADEWIKPEAPKPVSHRSRIGWS